MEAARRKQPVDIVPQRPNYFLNRSGGHCTSKYMNIAWSNDGLFIGGVCGSILSIWSVSTLDNVDRDPPLQVFPLVEVAADTFSKCGRFIGISFDINYDPDIDLKDYRRKEVAISCVNEIRFLYPYWRLCMAEECANGAVLTDDSLARLSGVNRADELNSMCASRPKVQDYASPKLKSRLGLGDRSPAEGDTKGVMCRPLPTEIDLDTALKRTIDVFYGAH